MKLYNLSNIRRKKRISREKMSKDLKISKEILKDIESTKIDACERDIERFAKYLKVPSGLLILKNENDIFRSLLDIYNIEISNEWNDSQLYLLTNNLLSKYIPEDDSFTVTNINKMMGEFKYRIGEKPPKRNNDNVIDLLRSLNNEDDNILEDDITDNDIALAKKHIRLDASLVAEAYKELQRNNLSIFECIELVKIIWKD